MLLIKHAVTIQSEPFLCFLISVGKGSYDTSFDHDGRDFQASNRQRMDDRDTAMVCTYLILDMIVYPSLPVFLVDK